MGNQIPSCLSSYSLSHSVFEDGKIEDLLWKKKPGQLLVSCQVMTNPCCGLVVIFCSFISHPIGCETINIPEIFSGVHGFTGTAQFLGQPDKTVEGSL